MESSAKSNLRQDAVRGIDDGTAAELGRTAGRRRRSLAWFARWMHTYVSLLGFSALIFFSVTGLTLNHAELFESADPVDRTTVGKLPEHLLHPDTDRLGVVEWLRRQLGAGGHVLEFESSAGELYVVFEGAGYFAEATVDLSSRAAELLETRQGAVAVLDDLHKGRGTGAAWSWVIDLSAVVLTLAGLTGLWLLWYVRARRSIGFAVTAGGSIVLLVVAVFAEFS